MAAHLIIQAAGQLHHKIIGAGRPEHLFQQRVLCLGIGKQQVLPNGSGKHAVSLGYIGKCGPGSGGKRMLHIPANQACRPLLRLNQPEK